MLVTTSAKVSDPTLSDILFALTQEYNQAQHHVYVACGVQGEPFQGKATGVLSALVREGWSDGFAKSIHNQAMAAQRSALACAQLEKDDKVFKLGRAKKRRRYLLSKVHRLQIERDRLRARSTLNLATDQESERLQSVERDLSASHTGYVHLVARCQYLGSRVSELSNRIATRTPSVVFGSTKLFAAQHHLEQSGYASFAAWQAEWFLARNHSFTLVGKVHAPLGNTEAKLSLDPQGDRVVLNLPRRLRHLNQGQIHLGIPITGLVHHRQHLQAALAPGEGTRPASSPVTVRFSFHPEKQSWYVHFTVERLATPQVTAPKRPQGVVAVDINPTHLDAVILGRDGNPWAKPRGKAGAFDPSFDTPVLLPLAKYPLKLDGTNPENRQSIGEAIAQIVATARLLGYPVVIEDLDFRKKKRLLRQQSPAQARALSSFAYAAITNGFAARCQDQGVYLDRVDPAWTSVLGMVNYAVPLGISSGLAAAICIGRRYLQLRERFFPTLVSRLPVDGREAKIGGVLALDRRAVAKALPQDRRQIYGLEWLSRHRPEKSCPAAALADGNITLLGARNPFPVVRGNPPGALRCKVGVGAGNN